MKTMPVFKNGAIGSIPFLLLVGCGGGSGGGGLTIPSANLSPAVIAEETAHEAAFVGLMLDEQLMDIVDLADMFESRSVSSMSARSIVPQVSSVEGQAKRSRTNVLGRISRNANLSQHLQTSRAVQSRSQSEKIEIPCDEGSMELSGTESSFTLRFKHCVSYLSWSDGDYIKDTTNGSVTFSEDSWSGYELAYRATLNLNVKTEEVWYGQPGSGELTSKGALTYGFKPNGVGLKINQYDLAGKGKDADGPWDGHFWIRDYSATIDFLGSKETVKYAGKAGMKSSDTALNGTLQIATDKALHYDAWPHSEFALGEAVEAVGANNSVLRVEFAPDGSKATVSLNGDLLEEFSSFSDFECWADGDWTGDYCW